MSNMKLTIRVYDTRHRLNQVGLRNWISSVCLLEQRIELLQPSQITVCLCYNRHCIYFEDKLL